MSKDFASIHTHTSYSQLDGASKIEELVPYAKELGMSSLGISDHGNLSGLIDFYKTCKKHDVHPVLGQEFYFCDDRTLKESVRQEGLNGAIDGSDKRYYHLSIYAENNDGYQNLLKLSSDAFTNGMYYKPRSDYSMLERHSRGLIVGSGCLGGPILQPLLYGDYDGALKTAQRLQDCVGKDNFFIELMNHGLPEQHRTNPQLVDIAKRIGARVYATQDTHYTHQSDSHAHEILLCQPAGAMIRKLDGSSSPIETIQVGDKLQSWRFRQWKQHESHLDSGTVTEVASREYDGELITFTTESGKISSYTHDHICVVNSSDTFLDDGNYVVYLQKSGDSYRVGKTTYQKVRSKSRPDCAVLGVLTRAKEQNAESAWILSVHKTEHEALEEEAFISWKYNIPTWSFPFPRKKGHEPRTAYYVSLWDRIGDLTQKAAECLKNYGRDIKYPFWSINDITRHGKWTPFVRACNVLSGMTVCVPTSGTTGLIGDQWERITVSRQAYRGKVYSIEVDKHHTYIADDILTHNCCQTGAKLSDEKRFHFHNDEYYLKSPDQMYDLFRDLPEACDNTLLIAERCNVNIDFDSLHLPKFPVPWGFASDMEYLTHLTKKGIAKFYPEAGDNVYERAAYELSVFESMGVASYMLILWDLLRFARNEGIFTPPGRGSAAGCLVSYVLGVTKVDPIKYDLIFERFLNPSRIALPDVDLDIEQRYREKMINYTIEKYGSDNVAQIITFGKMKARTAVKDTARVLGYPPALGNKISGLMPPLVSGVDTPLSACFDYSEKYANGYQAAQGLREEYDRDPDVRKVVDAARGIEGLIKSSGIHAAGIVIGDRPLDQLVPTWENSDGVRATQWDKKVVEALGLVKMDYLGLKNLDILSDTEQLIGNGFKVDDLPMDDPATYAMLRTGQTIGCFQVESTGMRSLLKRLRPDSIYDISAVLALFRPGPMAQNWHNMYADRKNGREVVETFHPDADEILKDTYGLMIYQEQIMTVATVFAGYSLTEADNLRKIIGKKLPDEMKAEAGKFIAGCVSQGHSETFGKELFDTIDGFSLYGFNKCLTGDTIVTKASGNQYDPADITIKELYDRINGPASPWKYKFLDPNRGLNILALDNDGRIRPHKVKNVLYSGEQPVYKVTLADGKSITSTGNHRHHTPNGWILTDNLKIGDSLTVNLGVETIKSAYKYAYSLNKNKPQNQGSVNGAFGVNNYAYAGGGYIALEEWTAATPKICSECGVTMDEARIERAHLDGDRTNNDPSNLRMMCVSHHKKYDYAKNSRNRKWEVGHLSGASEIISIEYVGVEPTYDLEMDFEGHNFVANGIVTHNSHSMSYAFITYWTAYLKTHYPREYMSVICSYVMDDLNDTAKYLGEARRMGLKVYPPDVNSSVLGYAVEEDGIRIGLGTLKNMGADSALKLIQIREEEPFKDLYDLALRVNPKAPALKSLAYSGALDQWGTRQGIASVVGEILTAARKDAKKLDQLSMFETSEVVNFNIPQTEFTWHELLAKEKEVLGIYASGHPLSDYENEATKQTISDAVEAHEKASIKVLVIIDDIEVKYTKAQKAMANFTIEDQTGAIEVVAFPKTYEDYGMILQPGAVVRLSLRKGYDDFRDRPNYVLTFAEAVESKIATASSTAVCGVFVPKGYHTKPQWMSKLKGVLLQNSGNIPVDIYISRSTKLNLENQYLVNGSQKLKDELAALFREFRGGE